MRNPDAGVKGDPKDLGNVDFETERFNEAKEEIARIAQEDAENTLDEIGEEHSSGRVPPGGKAKEGFVDAKMIEALHMYQDLDSAHYAELIELYTRKFNERFELGSSVGNH